MSQFRRTTKVASTAAIVLTILALAITAGPAVATGSRPAQVSRAPHYRMPPFGTLWVATAGALREFAPGSNLDVSPIATITSAGTELNHLTAVAIDRHAMVWATNTNPSEIVAYGPQDIGEVTPAISISGSLTRLDEPGGIAISRAGDIWVDNFGTTTIEEFAPGSHGNVAPIRIIGGSKTGLNNLNGLALTPDGKHLWVVDGDESDLTPAPALEEFAATAHGNVAPVRRIVGSKTGLNAAAGIVVGLGPLSPIVDTDANTLLSYKAGSHGNVAPKTTIAGASTGLNDPESLALTATGDVWVPNFNGATLSEYVPSIAGDQRPIATIQGESTFLIDVTAVAVFTAPPTAPRDFKLRGDAHRITLSWGGPKTAGGGVLGYVVRRRKTRSGTWHALHSGTARSFSTSHPHTGWFYDVEAYNETGDSPASHQINAP